MDEQTPRALKFGIGLLTALLWLAAIGTAAYWTMRFLDRSHAAPANAREVSMATAPQALNWVNLAARFGVEPARQSAATDVKVLGIVLPPAGARARAVLMLESSKATVVAEVGKEIADGPLAGAVVERITPTEVVLNRSAGQSQTLTVPDAKDARTAALISFTGTSNASITNNNQGNQSFTPNSTPPATPPLPRPAPLQPPRPVPLMGGVMGTDALPLNAAVKPAAATPPAQ